MEVLALFPGAAALDVVHAHSDGVVVGVNHGAVCGVSEAALIFGPCAAAPLILPTHLEMSRWKTETQSILLRVRSVKHVCQHLTSRGQHPSLTPPDA